MSSSSAEEINGSTTLCSRCKEDVLIEPNERPRQAETPRGRSAMMTPQKTIGTGQRNTVFNRLGPQDTKPSSTKRHLDFDAPFYNEDYYARSSGSASSSATQKTFNPPEPRDQRWYTYHSPKGVYTALSKSQKRRCQRIDCMARRRVVQETSAPKWQLKEKIGSDDERQTPTIMTELVQGKQLVNHDIETIFEEAEKWIKLLIRPGEMKARLKYFTKEAESKLPPTPIQEPFIRVRRNLHPPFLEEVCSTCESSIKSIRLTIYTICQKHVKTRLILF